MSKKLEGNGLWESSRMMLPQHREALQNQRNDRPTPPSKPTPEDIGIMKDYVLLPVMHGIIKKKANEIENSSTMLRALYAKVAHALAAHMLTDLAEIKNRMSVKSIQVFEQEKNDRVIHYRYICRGYEDTFAMAKDYMRAEISVRTSRYIDHLVASVYTARRGD
ncbi:hypothetical protein GK047_05550 [Paenibacillus sp. SYP-B3998]|uniref:Uncharacterized protein n=1 Tax=Paenibacillus sp. SYP-B3998 TaxID=2678564 RepID=A0A6G3ZTL6_9BACL|nr:hypothetical protein [Paenibacillus sp. SYP-B3998]NEW05482.1 hypothetical protein [Paenibacillus sp. SYP-B3998]